MTATLPKNTTQEQAGNKCWQYNGILFGGGSNEGGMGFHVMWPEVSFESRPMYTPSGRDVIGNEWDVTIRSYLIHHTSETPSTQQIRALLYGKLQQPNKELKIEQGYGIIGPTGDPDNNDVTDWVIMYGVRPKKLNLRTVNGLTGVLFMEWSFTAMTYICANVLPSSHTFSSYWASISWNIMPSGLQSRTVNGGYTVPLNISHRTFQTADYMRGFLTFDLPIGFKRTTNQWEESVDKSAMRFSITDEQFQGTPYPVGIVAADGSLDIGSEGPAFSEASATLSMSFEVAPNYHITTAPFHFITAMVATQATLKSKITPVDDEEAVGAVIPTRISLKRGLYDSSRKFTGSVTWMITGCVKDLITNGETWTPFADPQWAPWAASTTALRYSRGLALLAEHPATDIVANSCADSPTTSINYYDYLIPPGSGGQSPYVLVCNNSLVTEKNSWVIFDADIRAFSKYPTSQHAKAAAPSYFPVQPGPAEQPGENGRVPVADDAPSYNPEKFHLTEATGYPKHVIILSFVGLRLRFNPQAPVLTSADGKELIMIKNVVSSKEVGDVFGCKLRLLKQTVYYKFDGDLTSIKSVTRVSSCSPSNSLSNQV